MKNLAAILFLAVIFFSCSSEEQKDPGKNKNEELVKEYFQHFNEHDWVKMANLYTDTAEFKDPSLGTGIVKQTKEQTIKKYTELSATFPDVKDEIIHIYPSGEEHIFVEFISTGTAPDQSKFELPICTIFTFKDGKIIRDFTYYDNF